MRPPGRIPWRRHAGDQRTTTPPRVPERVDVPRITAPATQLPGRSRTLGSDDDEPLPGPRVRHPSQVRELGGGRPETVEFHDEGMWTLRAALWRGEKVLMQLPVHRDGVGSTRGGQSSIRVPTTG